MKKHWSLSYLWAKFNYWLFTLRTPNAPWFSQKAVELVDKLLKKSDTVFEYGSGRSTTWFAERTQKVVSAEHYEPWYDKVLADMSRKGIKNAELNFKSITGDNAFETDYVKAIGQYPDASFDVILVDGRLRGECAIAALPKLRKGGMLIVDDVHRYLPTYQPNSIHKNLTEKDLDAHWQKVYAEIKDWRSVVAHNKFLSTGFYFKA